MERNDYIGDDDDESRKNEHNRVDEEKLNSFESSSNTIARYAFIISKDFWWSEKCERSEVDALRQPRQGQDKSASLAGIIKWHSMNKIKIRNFCDDRDGVDLFLVRLFEWTNWIL